MNINFNTANNLKIKPARKKMGLGSLIIAMVVGATFIVAGFFFYKNSKIDPSWTRINGQVSSVNNSYGAQNGSTSYTPVISYSVNGQNYTVQSSVGSSFSPAIGTAEQIAYNPANPSEAKVVSATTSSIFILVFAGLGAIVLLFAPIAYIQSLRRSKNIGSLKETGQKLTGVLTDIQTINSGMNNDSNNGVSYKIVVSATDSSGAVNSYTSDTLQGIGGLAMANFKSQPIPIDVYVNPTNPSDYYVDISDIPNLTPERIAELLKPKVTTQNVSPPQTPPIAGPPTPPAPPAAPANPTQP